MPPEAEELRVSDLMTSGAGLSNKIELPRPNFKKRRSTFSIVEKLYFLNRKKILIFPLAFILVLSIYQAYSLYQQTGFYSLKVFLQKNADLQWLDNFSFNANNASLISEEKTNKANSREFIVKLTSLENAAMLTFAIEKEALLQSNKNETYERGSILKQIETIRTKISENQKAGNPDLLQSRADQEIHEYLSNGEASLKKRMEYYHKILYIDDFARHNVIEVFHLRKKELEIPLLKELENLSAFIQKESPEAVKELIDRIKIKQDEYLDELMQREMEDIPDKYLTPARKELLIEEKKIRILFHEWKLSESLYQAYRDKLEKHKTDSLDKLQIQSDLRLAENLFKKTETLDLKAIEKKSEIKVTLSALPIKGVSVSEIAFFTSLFVLFYTLMWAKLYLSEKKHPRINSVVEFEDRVKKAVDHQIKTNDFLLDVEALELNSFYQQVGFQYSLGKNIVGNTELILFCSNEKDLNLRNLAYLYSLGVSASNGRVCLVDTIEEGKWEQLGQLDRSLSVGLIEMINNKCDLKESVYGTEFRNLFVSPLSSETRISKSKTDVSAGAQWEGKFDKIVFAASEYLANDILDFFKNHHVVIYFVVSPGNLLSEIENELATFNFKNAEIKIIFKN